MQIREIHIEGFGIFADTRLKNLTGGLNVLFGANEAGKTTLIEFIRRILFGFPRKTKGTNAYPPLFGGTHGGKLFCELASGEAVVLARRHSGKEKITVSTDTGEKTGDSALKQVLGHAPKELFNHIHAFTLDELADFNSLKGDEIKNRIYGAGLGLGAVSLKDVDKALAERCDAVFKPRGKKRMNVLYEEIQMLEDALVTLRTSLGRYDELSARIERMEAERKQLTEKLQELEARKKMVETQKHLHPVVRELEETETALAALPAVPGFPEKGLEKLDALLLVKKELNNRLEEETRTLTGWVAERDKLKINRALLEKEAEVVFMQQSLKQVTAAMQQKTALEKELSRLNAALEKEHAALGADWQEDRILAFAFDAKQAQSFHEQFEALRDRVTRTREKLEYYRKRKQAEGAKGWGILVWLRSVGLAQCGLGLAGLGWGVFSGNPPVMGVSSCLLLLGALLLRKYQKEKREFFAEDAFGLGLEEKARKAEAEQQSLSAAWRAALAEWGLAETLTPIEARETGALLHAMAEKIRQRVRLQAEVRQMQETEQEVRDRLTALQPALTGTPGIDTLEAGIENAQRQFEAAKRDAQRSEHLQNSIQEQTKKNERLRQLLQQNENEKIEFLQQAGAENEDDFRAQHRTVQQRQSLMLKTEQKQNHIRSRLGEEADWQAFAAQLKATAFDRIEADWRAVAQEHKQLDAKRDALLQSLGEVKNQRDQLASNDDLSIKQTALEMRKQELAELGREWAAAKLARVLLDAARQQYETHRQPGVLKAAERVFAAITDGAYPKIVKPIDSDELLVENRQGDRRQLFELSRGTREQLYLSMRLGLIEEHDRRAEPLPVILDDVWVNFDETRRTRVLEQLKAFAEGRQVLALTCHAAVLKAYEALGANVVPFFGAGE